MQQVVGSIDQYDAYDRCQSLQLEKTDKLTLSLYGLLVGQHPYQLSAPQSGQQSAHGRTAAWNQGGAKALAAGGQMAIVIRIARCLVKGRKGPLQGQPQRQNFPAAKMCADQQDRSEERRVGKE